MAVASDGVHVGQDDLPVEKVRDLVGIKMIIGLSTHSPEQADKAVATGVADYIGVGPLFQTFTKKDVISAVGLDFLDYVVAHHKVPFVAIGGIKENNVLDVVRHGAKCVSLVTEIVGAVDIGVKIRAVREQITKTKAARSI
jgi:thiamine-phosphate pyrophosphorylase